MAKKKSAREIIIESFGGARLESRFFRRMTLEEYLGYVVAMVTSQNPGLSEGPEQILAMVREMVAEL